MSPDRPERWGRGPRAAPPPAPRPPCQRAGRGRSSERRPRPRPRGPRAPPAPRPVTMLLPRLCWLPLLAGLLPPAPAQKFSALTVSPGPGDLAVAPCRLLPESGGVPTVPSGQSAQARGAGDPRGGGASFRPRGRSRWGLGGSAACARGAAGVPPARADGPGVRSGVPCRPSHGGCAGPRAETRSGDEGAARRTVRGRPRRGLGAHPARCVPGSALGARPRGPRGACLARGPCSWAPQALPDPPGDPPYVHLEEADDTTSEIVFLPLSRQKLGAPGGSASCAPRPRGPRAGCTERQGHRTDRGGFCFLSCDFSAGPGRPARSAKRGAPRRGRAKPPAAGRSRVSQPPARADLVGLQCLQTHN